MINHTERPHARCSPSDFKRWGTCAGALTLQDKLDAKGLLPIDVSSPAAQLGTFLHEQAELAIAGHDVDLPEEIQAYVDFCLSLEGEHHVEVKSPLIYSPEEYGTCDFCAIDGEVLRIVDLKSGRYPVAATGSHQLLIYALGLITPQIKELHLTIFQFGKADTWKLDIFEARAIAKDIMARAKLALDDNVTTLTASDDACRFCACRAYCSAHTDGYFDVIENSVAGDMVRITDEKLVWILSHKKKIESFLNSVEALLYDRCDAGEAIKGVHIENGRKGNKTWDKDINPIEHMVQQGLHLDQAMVQKPITPTQALKLNPNLTGWYQPAGKPKIVCNNASTLIEDFEEI